MKLAIINMNTVLLKIVTPLMKNYFSELSMDYIQEKMRETRSRSRTGNTKFVLRDLKNFESDLKTRTDNQSEINLPTERFQIGGSNMMKMQLAENSSLPDERIMHYDK